MEKGKNYFNKGHYSNILSVIMTLEQIKGIGEKLGINIPENPLKVIKPVIISEPEETIDLYLLSQNQKQ
jgi:hypothetical protein